MPDADELERLMAPLLKKRLFVGFSKQLCDADEFRASLPDHLRYIIGLEKQGVLFAAGPLTREGETAVGMIIVRAPDLETARDLIAGDPFHQRGLREFTMMEWQLNEGRMQLEVDFSDGSYRLA